MGLVINWGAISVSAIILIATIGACVKSARYKGDITDRWRQRKSLTEEKLTERAIDALFEFK